MYAPVSYTHLLRVVGIAANGKILRVVGGNADVPHSFVQLLLCGGHIPVSYTHLKQAAQQPKDKQKDHKKDLEV